MSVQVEKQEKNTAKLTVEVGAELFEKALQATYLKQKKNILIPGFRKGKAPRMLIEKMYGPEIFYEDAANEILKEEYPKAADECGEKVVSRPQISVEQIEKGKPFIFTAVVAIAPEVKLGEYKGIEVPIQDRSVTDEEIERELKYEQEKNSRMISVEDRPAQMDDTVTLDYAGEIDGVAFDGGTAQGHKLALGSGAFIPGFEEQLVGANVGDELDVNVKFPEDYHAEELKGKDAVFHCKIHKIEQKELPELDDEFAMDVSEFDTIAEYKDDIKKKLEDRKERAAKNADIDAAVAKAAKNAEMELPDILINDQAENLLESYGARMRSQGMDIGQYAQMMGMSYTDLLNSMKPQAEVQLRSRYTLEKIAEEEGLEVTDEYIDTKVRETAGMYGMEVEETRALLMGENPDRYKEELRIELASEFVGENAKETEAATKEAEEEAKKQAEEAAKRAEAAKQSEETTDKEGKEDEK